MITKLDKTLITMADAARKFKRSKPVIRHWIATGRLDAVDVGRGKLMIPDDATDKGARHPWSEERDNRILLRK
jgi:hypothetical protein